MSPSIDDIWLALYLFEPGTTSYNQESFTVIDGPCSLNDGVDLGKTYAFENKTVIWKMKVKDNPVWKNGITPLSLTPIRSLPPSVLAKATSDLAIFLASFTANLKSCF